MAAALPGTLSSGPGAPRTFTVLHPPQNAAPKNCPGDPGTSVPERLFPSGKRRGRKKALHSLLDTVTFNPAPIIRQHLHPVKLDSLLCGTAVCPPFYPSRLSAISRSPHRRCISAPYGPCNPLMRPVPVRPHNGDPCLAACAAFLPRTHSCSPEYLQASVLPPQTFVDHLSPTKSTSRTRADQRRRRQQQQQQQQPRPTTPKALQSPPFPYQPSPQSACAAESLLMLRNSTNANTRKE